MHAIKSQPPPSTFSLLRRLGAPFSTQPCKIYGGPAKSRGAIDFSKSCMENAGIVRPKVGVPVPYWGCKRCGFVFTDFCDTWT